MKHSPLRTLIYRDCFFAPKTSFAISSSTLNTGQTKKQVDLDSLSNRKSLETLRRTFLSAPRGTYSKLPQPWIQNEQSNPLPRDLSSWKQIASHTGTHQTLGTDSGFQTRTFRKVGLNMRNTNEESEKKSSGVCLCVTLTLKARRSYFISTQRLNDPPASRSPSSPRSHTNKGTPWERARQGETHTGGKINK